MGRMSKRSLAIRKGWETRKKNIQEKFMQFQQGRIMESKNTVGQVEGVDPRQVALPFSPTETPAQTIASESGHSVQPEASAMEGRTIMRNKKKQTARRKPIAVGRRKSVIAESQQQTQSAELGKAEFSWEQIQAIERLTGVKPKAFYDGHVFRLLKQDSAVAFAQ